MYKADKDRYCDMQYSRCGKSGLKLPTVSLGLWHNFGVNDDFENMKNMIFTAFDNGITHFDLANNYGPFPGRAEENFGKILADMGGYRDEMVISTKAGYNMWEGPYGDFGSRKYLLASLDQSLKRMGVDYVDIFYHHRPDPDTPLEESMGALARAVESGKALYVGISNYGAADTVKAAEILRQMRCPFIINQVRYSILDRHIESDSLKEIAARVGIGLIAYSPLAQGILTDRYLGGIPQDSRIVRDGRFLKRDNITPQIINAVESLRDIAYNRGQSLAQMALAWVLKDGFTSVLIGASKCEQILNNLQVVDKTHFTDDEINAIDEAVKGLIAR